MKIIAVYSAQEPHPLVNPDYGNRVLGCDPAVDDDVFAHNCWDNAEWSEKMFEVCGWTGCWVAEFFCIYSKKIHTGSRCQNR